MNLPKDKNYPPDAVQCHGCGGLGCVKCHDKGWVPTGHPGGRLCHRSACHNPIPPSQVAIYCSDECAFKDA
jgi:hypothetical protein